MRRVFGLILAMCLLLPAAMAEKQEPYITQYTHGDRTVNRIAVTIDDWYEPDMLPAFLDAAKEHGAKLTLYPIGVNIMEKDRASWQRVLDEGHELGNHSNTHKNLADAGRDSIIAQLNNMEKRLEKALGYPHEMNTVRYPFGAGRMRGLRSAFAKAVNEAGYSHVALWDIDSTDPDEILRRAENGSIILLHGRKRDLRALQTILPELKARGYELVTVSELLGLSPSP